MAGRIIKVAGLVVLAAALSAPIASAMRIGEPGSESSSQSTATAPNKPYNPNAYVPGGSSDAVAQGIQNAGYAQTVAPNDRAGTQGVGQTSGDPIGMGGQYGLNLIQDARGVLAPTGAFVGGRAPDERGAPQTSVKTPVSSTGNDINWGAAGTGAAGFAALALAIVLLTALARRGRHGDVAVS
jgi:hypothetical protein